MRIKNTSTRHKIKLNAEHLRDFPVPHIDIHMFHNYIYLLFLLYLVNRRCVVVVVVVRITIKLVIIFS